MNLNFMLSFTKTIIKPNIYQNIYRNKSGCMNYLRTKIVHNFIKCGCIGDKYYCSQSSSKLEENEHEENNESKEKVNYYIKNQNKGTTLDVSYEIGETVLDGAVKAGADVAASCCGQLKCTTCHMYVDKEVYDKLEPPTIMEDDMLDKALFLKENSRLTCQIKITKELEGATFTLPKGTKHFVIDTETLH